MPFSPFDRATTDLLFRVYDAAWLKLETAGGAATSPPQVYGMRAQLTRQLLDAANTGERDFAKLKTLALAGILPA